MVSEKLIAKTEINVFINKEISKVIINALKPETENTPSDRSKIQIVSFDKGIKILIESEDITSLRSAVNTYLYWINGIINITSKFEKK
ncbi:hypothetical protein JW865_03260 [Candidatus Bathyarchaeota archaeon]|nr:hypothetical protein [Candidatus Bathyarchaeota archaeon]